MADNLPVAGGTAATDEVGGVHYQRIKLDVGGDGATQPVTEAAPLPVKDQTGAYDEAFTAAAGVDVGDTSTVVVTDSAGARKEIILSNASDTGIWVAFGSTATLNNGLYLPPNGGRYSGFYSGPIAAIHGAAAATKRLGVVAF